MARRRQPRPQTENLPAGLVELFWFPWCTDAYRKDFIDRKYAELRASGRYWDVQKRYAGKERVDGKEWTFYKLFVKVGRFERGLLVDRHEWARRQGVDLATVAD